MISRRHITWIRKSQNHAIIIECVSKVMLTGVEWMVNDGGGRIITTFGFLVFFISKSPILSSPLDKYKIIPMIIKAIVQWNEAKLQIFQSQSCSLLPSDITNFMLWFSVEQRNLFTGFLKSHPTQQTHFDPRYLFQTE